MPLPKPEDYFALFVGDAEGETPKRVALNTQTCLIKHYPRVANVQVLLNPVEFQRFLKAAKASATLLRFLVGFEILTYRTFAGIVKPVFQLNVSALTAYVSNVVNGVHVDPSGLTSIVAIPRFVEECPVNCSVHVPALILLEEGKQNRYFDL